MTWRRILTLVLAVQIAVLAGMALIFSGMDVALAERELLGLRSLFPAGRSKPLDLGEWKGVGLPAGFRVLESPCGEDVDIEALLRKSFVDPRVIERVSIGERGLYGLKKRAKGYAAVAVFKQGRVLYWLDVDSARSSLDHRLRAFHACLLNLKVQSRPPSPALADELQRIEGRLSPLVIQTVRQFLLFMAALFLAVMAVVWVVMRLSGAPPASAAAAALCTPYQTMLLRSFGRKSSPCCLCLENEQVVVYVFRREKARLDARQARGALDPGKRRLAIGPYVFILDAEAFDSWRVRLG